MEVEPFYMGKYEVTQAEYLEFLSNYERLTSMKPVPTVPDDRAAEAVTYPTPMYELEAGPIFDRMGRGGRHPAVIMSAVAAKQYTKWLSKKTGRFYRLPTEAEWEYACRAGSAAKYNTGDDEAALAQAAWYLANADGHTHPVGRKRPNTWGLYDTHGNVWEWCSDGFADPPGGEAVDPAGDPGAADRVVRSSSWGSDAELCRTTCRGQAGPGDRVIDIGLRPCVDLP